MGTIGFIGLGIMGRPMAKNLLKAGYKVAIFDIVPAAVEEIAVSGGIPCKSIKEVVETSDEGIIITMLPNSPNVKAVVLEDSGIIHYAKPGTLIVDMSSIAPAASREMHDALMEKGIHMIDAPVSGGEPGAVAGTIAIMVGGAQEDFDRALPLFKVMGGSYTLIGGIGSGNICKLTNQVIVALNIMSLAEGMMLAKMSGTDPQKVFEGIRGGLAGSTVMNTKTPMMLADNYKPGFRIELHIKDLKNALDTADLCKAPLPFAKQVLDILQNLAAEGDAKSDHSAIAKFYEELSGVKFTD